MSMTDPIDKKDTLEDLMDKCLNDMNVLSNKTAINTKVPNPDNASETCVLITTKKTKYYTYTYNPSKIHKLLSETKFFPTAEEVFDFTIRERCCNCISISLYDTSLSLETLVTYLTTIERSIKNIKQCLPDWVVRIYLDPSVLALIQANPDGKYANDIKDIIDNIYEADNVEIYTYCCKDILNKTTDIIRARTFRFLPITEQDVNISITRQADGIVTCLDCHNINVFSKSDRIFFLTPSIPTYAHLDDMKANPYDSYSTWLTYYKLYIEHDYFSKNNNLYDILAGTLGIQLKVKRSHYDKQVIAVQQLINSTIAKALKGIRPKYIDSDGFIDESTLTATTKVTEINKNPAEIKILNTGFDEILLLHMFRDFVSAEYIYKSIEINGKVEGSITYTNLEKYKLIKSLIYAQKDMQILKFTTLVDDSEIINLTVMMENLILHKIIKPIGMRDIKALIKKFHTLFQHMELHYVLLGQLYFIDNLFSKNMITPQMFDVQGTVDIAYTRKKEREIKMLNMVNIPYGALKDHTYMDRINIENLKMYDFVYDLYKCNSIWW
jgi:hypothetical protein